MKTMGFWEVFVEVLENFQEEQLIVPLGFGLFKAKAFCCFFLNGFILPWDSSPFCNPSHLGEYVFYMFPTTNG